MDVLEKRTMISLSELWIRRVSKLTILMCRFLFRSVAE